MPGRTGGYGGTRCNDAKLIGAGREPEAIE